VDVTRYTGAAADRGRLDGVTIADRPAEPLHELCREVVAVEISEIHSLEKHDGG
jgi:hypothetical protein